MKPATQTFWDILETSTNWSQPSPIPPLVSPNSSTWAKLHVWYGEYFFAHLELVAWLQPNYEKPNKAQNKAACRNFTAGATFPTSATAGADVMTWERRRTNKEENNNKEGKKLQDLKRQQVQWYHNLSISTSASTHWAMLLSVRQSTDVLLSLFLSLLPCKHCLFLIFQFLGFHDNKIIPCRKHWSGIEGNAKGSAHKASQCSQCTLLHKQSALSSQQLCSPPSLNHLFYSLAKTTPLVCPSLKKKKNNLLFCVLVFQ